MYGLPWVGLGVLGVCFGLTWVCSGQWCNQGESAEPKDPPWADPVHYQARVLVSGGLLTWSRGNPIISLRPPEHRSQEAPENRYWGLSKILGTPSFARWVPDFGLRNPANQSQEPPNILPEPLSSGPPKISLEASLLGAPETTARGQAQGALECVAQGMYVLRM